MRPAIALALALSLGGCFGTDGDDGNAGEVLQGSNSSKSSNGSKNSNGGAGQGSEPTRVCEDDSDCGNDGPCQFYHPPDLPDPSEMLPPPVCRGGKGTCTTDEQCGPDEQCHAGNMCDHGPLCGPSCPVSDCETDADCGGAEACMRRMPTVEADNPDVGNEQRIFCPTISSCTPRCDPKVHVCTWDQDMGLVCDSGPCGQDGLDNYCEDDGTCARQPDCTKNIECAPGWQMCITDVPPGDKPFCGAPPCETKADCNSVAPNCIDGECSTAPGACF